MSVFLSLFVNLLPLYALIGLGYFAGRVLKVDRQSLGTLAIYIFMPIVVFGFVADLEFKLSYIVLPIILYVSRVIVSLLFLMIGKRVFGDTQANLMALCAAMGNTMYFGLPLVVLLFPHELVPIYIFMALGGVVFEATVGYYIAARGNFDARTALMKILYFPSLYAIILGLCVNFSQIELPDVFWVYWTHFKGAYIVIGMMIIGTALANIKHFVIGRRFLYLVFLGKFFILPIIHFIFVLLDSLVLHWFDKEIYALLMIVSFVPPAANIATLAAQLNLQPEKAATTILIGTIFALFYIPLMVWLFNLGI
ncbi:MAG: transporter [Alphaproteobacteria bacterium]|nr:MAG: transporter [Alphaproteobacteria bacterium]